MWTSYFFSSLSSTDGFKVGTRLVGMLNEYL